MVNVSPRTLKILSALVWYAGGIVLLLKGTGLLVEAIRLKPAPLWPGVAIGAGVIIGSLKAKSLFSAGCKKNLERIDRLESPKIWQFFQPGFLVFLAAMITLGATLSRLAHANYPFLIGVALLDFTIAIALFGSSYVFWQEDRLRN